jgi:segregation and condensation protein B
MTHQDQTDMAAETGAGVEAAERADAQAGQKRLVEALLFASAEPLAEADLRAYLPEEADLPALLAELQADYQDRGVSLVRVAQGWAFRTAEDLAPRLRREVEQARPLTKAALETLAIIAYHQPVTRAEIEGIRGVSTSKGTLDTLMEAGWIRPGRRRQTPGKPLTWVTTKGFLDHFALASLEELPGVEELKAAGLLDSRPAIATLPGGSLGDGEDEDSASQEAEEDEPGLFEPPEPADEEQG